MSEAPTAQTGRRNVRAKSFRALFDRLPPHVRKLSVKAFKLFLANPAHKSLRWHRLKDNDRGAHRNGSVSVSINMQYRSLYYEDGETNVWYWTGTKADHDIFTGLS